MASTERLLVASSGGKDSLLALHRVRAVLGLEVASLVTTLNTRYERVSMHGLRRPLIEEQAEALGLPLYHVPVFAEGPPLEFESGRYEGGLFRSYPRLPGPADGFTGFPSNEDYDLLPKGFILEPAP